MTDDNNNTLRAVFLAALMVLWVFAGTVAFAGGAAAVSDGDITNTQASPDDNSASEVTGYTISTEFENTNDPASDNPSGVAAVEVDLSDASQFGGNTDNFSGAQDVIVTIDDPNAGAYGESQSRVVPLQDTTNEGDSIALDFQEKENVSDDATLTVDFDDNTIQNPSVDGTYELQFRSYTDEGPSNNFKAENASYQIAGDGGGDQQDRETDTKFAGGQTRWKGQVLDFVAKPAQCNADTDSYQLRYYTPDETTPYGNLVREISLNGSNGAQIPTENVADNERVVITAVDNSDNTRKIVDVGPDANNPAPAGEQTADCYSETDDNTGDQNEIGDDDFVEIVPQTLDASFQDDTVATGDNETLEVDSNRNGYDLYVDSDDFSQSELANIVNGSTTQDINEDRAPSSTAVRVNDINSSAAIDFDFGGVETGNYSFDLSPTDTTPTDNASIEVVEPVDREAEFRSDSGSFTVKRGDIQSPEGDSDATISVNASDLDFVSIVIGGEDYNYETVVTAEPDEDGQVDIRMNTFLAGQLNESNESRAFEATSGEVVDVNRRSPKLTGVLDETSYPITLQDTDGNGLDQGTLTVAPSSYENLSQQRHPDASLNSLDEVSEVANNSDFTDTKKVTLSEDGGQRDIAVHKVEISGIYGALDAIAENDLDEADGNNVLADAQTEESLGVADEPVLEVELNQTNFQINREPKVADYNNPDTDDSDQFRFVIDEDNETLYVVTDVQELELDRETGAGNESAEVEPGDDFEFEFDVGPGFENQFQGGIDTYVPEGGTTTQLDTEERMGEFDPQNEDRITVNPESNVTLSGQTNVAPGTDLTIQVRQGESIRRANDTQTNGSEERIFGNAEATVDEDGNFSAEFDTFEDVEVNRTFFAFTTGADLQNSAQKPGVVVEGTPASVALSDVEAGPDQDEVASITVDEVFLPNGGFVTIHDGSLQDGATLDSVRGTSEYLEEGNHSDVEIELDDPYTEDGTAIAMPHKDTNGNETYDFVTSNGSADGPYTAGEEIVVASASVTFQEPTATQEPTDEPSPTATQEPTETMSDDTATPTGEGDGQPGFGAALALIALIGAALLAARRNDF